jgi:hypothetical protein
MIFFCRVSHTRIATTTAFAVAIHWLSKTPMILSEFIISQRDSALALFATYVTIALRIFYTTYNGVVFICG